MTKEEIIQWSDGNPGAAMFLIQVMTSNALCRDLIIDKLTRCKTIRGTNLYVLYSDICDKDIDLVAFLTIRVSDELLEDVCSKQDSSGKETLKQYIDQYN